MNRTLSRAARRWLSGTLVAALLLVQAMVAAHACASVWRGATPPAGAAATDPDCPGHAAKPQSSAPAGDDVALCKAHCERGDQAVGAAVPPLDNGADLFVVVVLDWRIAASGPALAASAMPPLPTGAPPPGSPPLYLSLLVLRN